MASRHRTQRPSRSRKRSLSEEESLRLNFREVEFLRQFLTESGRIRPRTATGLRRRDQARLARAVKQARELALLPYRTEAANQVHRGGRR